MRIAALYFLGKENILFACVLREKLDFDKFVSYGFLPSNGSANSIIIKNKLPIQELGLIALPAQINK